LVGLRLLSGPELRNVGVVIMKMKRNNHAYNTLIRKPERKRQGGRCMHRHEVKVKVKVKVKIKVKVKVQLSLCFN
jgi:hypothetical protein